MSTNNRHIDELEKIIISLEGLLDIDQNKPTMKDYNKLAVFKSQCGFPALESMSVSKESIAGTISDGFKYLSKRLGGYIKDYFDRLESFYTFFELQSSKAANLKNELLHLKRGTKKSVHLPVNKYMMYGKKAVVINTTEYKKKYKEVCSVMGPVVNETATFLEKDLFRSISNLFSLVNGSYDESFMSYFSSMHALVDTVKKSTNATGVQSGDKTEYHSDTYLGMSHFEFKMPSKNSFDIRNPSTCRKVAGHFWTSLWREEKFELGLFQDKVLFEMTDRDCNDILEDSLALISNYQKALSFRTKLSHMLNIFVINDSIYSMFTLDVLKYLLSNYRIMVRAAWMIEMFIGNVFTYSRGVVGSGLNVVEKYLNTKDYSVSTESANLYHGGYTVVNRW